MVHHLIDRRVISQKRHFIFCYQLKIIFTIDYLNYPYYLDYIYLQCILHVPAVLLILPVLLLHVYYQHYIPRPYYQYY